MIIIRSPLRITLGGGSTDVPSYYEKFGGFCITAAINRYVYIMLHETFTENIILKYSKTECIENISKIKHPIIKESFDFVGIDNVGLELTCVSDIPAGTGLGSSSSFTVALLKTLHTYKKNFVTTTKLAEQACYIEIDKLKEPIGKQDQYSAACGGIMCFTFLCDGKVEMKPLKISKNTLHNLTDNLLLFFTGYSRSSSNILQEQNQKSQLNDVEMINNLHNVKEGGFKSKICLENGDLTGFSKLMNSHWQYKKQRNKNISNSKIDKWYDLAINNGALGGTLVGAGGGGFLMFYVEDKTKLRKTMQSVGLKEIKFDFDFEGVKQIL